MKRVRLLALIILLSLKAYSQDVSVTNLSELPSSGMITSADTTWAGWNWPYAEGGLNSNQNDLLSPLKKIELITKNTLSTTDDIPSSPRNYSWWMGYCDAIVSASANYSCEPSSVDFQLDDRTIHFNREEMKGVIAYFFRKANLTPEAIFGSRTKIIDPLIFHLALTNIVGIEMKPLGFVFGGAPIEIHDHLITSYKSEYSKEQNGTLIFVTTVWYAPEMPEPTHDLATAGTKKEVTFRYQLSVDTNGNLSESRSNKWISSENPKILWVPPKYRVEYDENVPSAIKQLIIKSLEHCHSCRD